ncbi:hypothetical protein H6P81_002201 [Aristolochia fimbriata]|uniref:Uncharacterized protein n=1 Tax=Aristolochia fimbriata TaxID=158543 RepID=A0AAV7F9T7_ARIFI|nr:hypothetical protein H6P81_002201 [Aristolochia fimbriata]
MAEADERTSRANGESEGQKPVHQVEIEEMESEESLYGALHRLVSQILFPDTDAADSSSSIFQRIKTSVSDNASSVRKGSKNSTRKLLSWTRRGSPLRALLVISVGTITSLALTGLLVFMFFFLAATANAIIISLLISLAAAGGFLALFFACVASVYIAAMSLAFFVISTATISTIIAVLIATGWIGFLWAVWLAAKKSIDVTKHSLSVTGSALSAYSSARYNRNQGFENLSPRSSHAHSFEPEKLGPDPVAKL